MVFQNNLIEPSSAVYIILPISVTRGRTIHIIVCLVMNEDEDGSSSP